MTDRDFYELIASFRGIDVESIRVEVENLKMLALLEIQTAASWYWNREIGSFALSANSNEVDMKSVVDRYFAMVKFFWTSYSKLKFCSESRYRRKYPDGMSISGTPTLYVPLDNNSFLFAPTPTIDTTINISYIKSPRNSSIEQIPDEFHFVPLNYVLAFYSDKDGDRFFFNRYEKGLAQMVARAKKAEEEEIEIEMDSFSATLARVQDAHSGR